MANRYQCSNQPFYREWIMVTDGKINMFACQDFINDVVHYGYTELHTDSTFKVIPSTPQCRQLFNIHTPDYSKSREKNNYS